MPIYMKYNDGAVKGDVTAEGHEAWIECNSFQWGVGRGISSPTGASADRESSAPSVSEIVVTKPSEAVRELSRFTPDYLNLFTSLAIKYNVNIIGGSHFTPIVYAPQVAILGVGQGGPKAVIVDGKIAVRTLLPLCLAYDHRVLDGADAVRFLKEVIHYLESFPEMELSLQ